MNGGANWYISRKEYYSTIKRNKLLIHTTWMNFKNMQYGRGQTQKTTS
jgi:hypothetical protein